MGKTDPGDSHPVVKEWGGTWVVPSQVRVVWAIPWQSTWAQTFPTSIKPASVGASYPQAQEVDLALTLASKE
jgi:hypothetical protein